MNAPKPGWRRALNTLVHGSPDSPDREDREKGAKETPGLATKLAQPDRAGQAPSGQASPGQATLIASPKSAPSTGKRGLTRLRTGKRRKVQQNTQGDSTEELLDGYEGLDYEVVRSSSGPGTKGAVLVLVLMLGIALIAGVRTVDWLRQKLDPSGDPTGEVIVGLPPGSSSAAVSELLADNGVIPDATAYEWYVRLRGGPTFQAGDYVFQQNSSVWEALEVLRGGPVQVEQADQFVLTIPEGLTVDQMAALIGIQENLRFSGADFLDVLDITPALSTIALPPTDIAARALNQSEGFLFGDTYFLTATTTVDQLIATMASQMDFVLTGLNYTDSFAQVGLTPYEALIVASIVEGEASRPEDRPKLAQVIYNRLATGMTLGMDATVRYLVGGADVDALALSIDSPYNTRLNLGLPPTPINSPSRQSLAAALNPEPGDWLFVVKTAEDGTLSFSVEYEQFLQDRAICIELGFCG